MRIALFALLLLLLPVRAPAGIEVVASIAPVHSLVAQVMDGVGAPRLLLPPGASPHDYALRPSDAVALEQAALVFRVGPELERWLGGPLAALASRARIVTLANVPGLTLLPIRESAGFDPRDDGDAVHDADEADPHLWLDPENAKLWLGAIASALAVADPHNSDLYQANARKARSGIEALVAEIEARLAPVRGRPFIVFHDAYHYFEARFGIEAEGAVALSDASAPGPARIAAIRDRIAATGAVCLFREPQFRAGLVETVAEGTGARIGVLDPLGAGPEPGPGLYAALLIGLAESIAGCLG